MDQDRQKARSDSRIWLLVIIPIIILGLECACGILDFKVPAAPSGLQAAAGSSPDSQIDLTWTDNSNDEYGFKIERKIGTDGAYTVIGRLDSDVTSFSDVGLWSETSYFYRVYAYNADGKSENSNEATATTIILDITPPDTAITSQPLIYTNQNTANFDFTSTESGSTFACQLDAGALVSCTSPSSYSGLSGGSHVFQVKATDASGNTDQTPASYSWAIDIVPPVQSGWSYASGSTITTESPTIALSLNENGDCRWSLSDEDYSLMVGDCTGDGTRSISCAVSGLFEGANTVYIACRDLIGNEDTVDSNEHLAYTADTAPPIQSGWSPVSGASTSTTITFNLNESGNCKWSRSDLSYGSMAGDCTGDGSTSISCAVSGLFEGANTVYIACQDFIGNSDTINSNMHFIYTFDVSPPIQSGWSPVIGASTSTTITFNLNESGNCKWSRSDLSYGSMAGDCAGDGSTSISCAVSGLSIGVNIIYLACQDMMNPPNKDTASSNKHLAYTVDNSPPEQSGWSPVVGTSTSPTITFNLNEDGDCRWSLVDQSYDGMDGDCTGDGTKSISCAVSGLSEGANTVYLACQDMMVPPNKDTVDSNKNLGYTVDNVLPVQSGWSPVSGSTLTTKSPAIALSLNEKGDCKWSLSDDSYSWMSGDCTGDRTMSISCAISGLPEGANTVYIACRDLAGNADTPATNTQLTYTVDTTPPVQSGWNPPASSIVLVNSFVINLDLSDSGDCKWSLSDQSYANMGGDCLGDNTTSISCAVSGLSEGEEIVYIACRDSLGNADTVSSNKHLAYTVDTAPPVQSGWSPVVGTSTSPTITFSLDENGDCRWSLSDQSYDEMGGDCTGDGTTFISCGISGLSEGANTVYLACEDTRITPNKDIIDSNEHLIYIVDVYAPVQSGWSPVVGTSTSPTITFSLDENGDCRWSFSDQSYDEMGGDCTGDGTTFISCSVSELSEGANTVYLACQDVMIPPNKDSDVSNTHFIYTIDTTPPDTSITSQPSDPSFQGSASFQFDSTEGGSTFECRLDKGSWEACLNPKSYPGPLTVGDHFFHVRATDPLGNTDLTPAYYTWEIIDNTPPVFSGLRYILALSDTEAMLFWDSATDDMAPQSEIVYDICQSTTSSTCASSFTATYTAGSNLWNYTVTNLTAGQTYYFLIRARDSSGNRDTNAVEKKREYLAAVQISAGMNHTCALLADGTVKCWGLNNAGQLGNGTNINSNIPVYVSGITTAIEISTGEFSSGESRSHTCARLANSTIKCWGFNNYGQLGNGTTINSNVPVTVFMINTATEINAGGYHTCARLANNNLKCWGYNGSGQLGDETYTRSSIPVTVSGITTAEEISAGGYHTCARLNDGTLKCWGNGYYGQLGNGINTGSNIPIPVPGITTAAEISTGGMHTCAKLVNNTLKCWGYNSYGQLGNGTTTNSNVPVTVSGMTAATEISAGGYHTCARLTDNTLKCWGYNNYGQSGNGTNGYSNIPAVVSGITAATEISTGGYHTCARLTDNTLKCWGYNEYGQVGNGVKNNSNIPVSVFGMTTAVEISAGNAHTCARLTDSTIKCWGFNNAGQLGNGTAMNSNIPVAVTGITTAVEINAGRYHTCALLADSTIKCWGLNNYGQLGNGTNTNSSIPVSVSGINMVIGISAGGQHTCAKLADSTFRCWGYNNYGQLGIGTTTDSNVPVTVSVIYTAAEISAGLSHTCARLFDGTLKCWGYNIYGQLGNGTYENSSSPVTVLGINEAAEIVAADMHTCARLIDNTLRCWGHNSYGQLGNGDNTGSNIPVTVSGVTTAVEISAGGYHTCARLANNTIRCWGLNDYGQLGNDTTTNWNIPVTVYGITTAAGVSVADKHTCARLTDNTVKCWGINDIGTLGGGYSGNAYTPIPVNNP